MLSILDISCQQVESYLSKSLIARESSTVVMLLMPVEMEPNFKGLSFLLLNVVKQKVQDVKQNVLIFLKTPWNLMG